MLAFFKWFFAVGRLRWLPLVVAAFTALPFFYELGESPVYMWDEAVYADNAVEMAENGHVLVMYNRGEVSNYNVKPPLAIWLEALSLKSFGYNEWALRLPSALASWLTALMVFFFGRITLKSNLTGFVAALIFATSLGIIRPHMARSADLDALLLFWITAYSLLFIHFLIHGHPSLKNVIPAMAVLIVLAFYTKSVAAFLPIPGLILAAGFRGRLMLLIKNSSLYFWLGAGIAACGFYLLIRESIFSGYMELVWTSEYMRMGENVMPWHEHPFGFYFLNFFERHFFTPWLFLLPLAAIFFGHSSETKHATWLLTLFAGAYLLLISIPKVKLEWYDGPVYPALSLLAALGITGAFRALTHRLKLAPVWTALFSYAAVAVCIGFHVPELKQELTRHEPRDPLEQPGYTLRSLSETHPEWKHITICMEPVVPEHLDQVWYYIESLNASKDAQHRLLTRREDLFYNDTVLVCHPDLIAWTDSLPEFQPLLRTTYGLVGVMP